MSSPTLPELCRFLDSIHAPWVMLGNSETGRALVIEEGARVLAMAAPGSGRNVLWTHPALTQCKNRAALANVGAGGVGGLRVWQAPEAAYMWKGAPDPKTFSNYKVQDQMDPGQYSIKMTSANRCVISGTCRLEDYRGGSPVEFQIRRIIELSPLPKSSQLPHARGMKLRFQNHLHLKTGDENSRVDLWHLMQLPPGTVVGAQVRKDTQPQVYFNPENADGWAIENGCFAWTTNGKRMSKMGLGTASVMGGPFAICHAGPVTGIHAWNIPVWPGTDYVDSPPGEHRDDQIVQFWDGFDFCEMEYHSPGVSLKQPEIFDTSELTYLEFASEKYEPFQAIHYLLPR